MDVGVAGANHDVVVAIKQQEAVKTVRQGLDHEVEAEQRRPMGDARGRQAERRPIKLDIAVCPIDHAGQHRGEKQHQQQQVLETARENLALDGGAKRDRFVGILASV